jgi:hypothetical protein
MIDVGYKEVLTISFMLALVTHNLFFDIYRGAVFNVVPHDHYEYYAFYFLGDDLGKLPPQTHAYRVIAVLFALPFYYILPLFTFSGAEPPAVDENYLQMLISFSFVTYVSVLVTCITTYLIARKRFGVSILLATVIVLWTYLMLRHLREGLYGVDAMGVMVVTLTIYHMNNKWLYALLVIMGVFVNEKVAMIFFMLMAGRWLFYRPRQLDIYLIAPVIALFLYAAVNVITPHFFTFSSGTGAHRDIANFLPQFIETFMVSLTMKGIILNVVPVMILFGLYYLANTATKYIDTGIYFKSADVVVLLGILFIGHLINVDYNVGRIAMYVFPLYLPLACIALYQFFPSTHGLVEEQKKNV